MILVCQRVPLMLVYVYNGTVRMTVHTKGSPLHSITAIILDRRFLDIYEK